MGALARTTEDRSVVSAAGHIGRAIRGDRRGPEVGDHTAASRKVFVWRCDASLRLMPTTEIVFEAQMLDAAATAPHKLEGLYPDLDMPFDIVRGHRLIRLFSLYTLGDHRLIGHKKQRTSRNAVGKSCSKDCCSLHVDRHTSCTTQQIPEAIIVFPDATVGRVHSTGLIVVTEIADHRRHRTLQLERRQRGHLRWQVVIRGAFAPNGRNR
jgi:hypothetical protein